MKINRLLVIVFVILLSLGLVTIALAAAATPTPDRESESPIQSSEIEEDNIAEEVEETADCKDCEEDLSSSIASELTVGGPDSFGHVYFDSNDPGGPIFQWVEISTTGTLIPFGDETYHGPFPIGFEFNYYGVNYVDFWAGSNGWTYLGTTSPGSADLSNDCPIPLTDGIENYIAGLHDDLDNNTIPDDLGYGYYQSFSAGSCPYAGYAGACTVVEWEGMYHYASSPADDLTFEIILFDNDEFLIQFLDASNEAGSGSTTGIENSNATDGLTYACNSAGSIADNLAILFTFTPVNLINSEKLAPGFVEFGDPIHYTINISNTGVVSALNAVMTDVIPAGTEYIADSLTCSSGTCWYDSTDDAVYWSGVVEAPPGQSMVSVDFDVQPVTCGALIENVALVDDPNMIGGPVYLNTTTEVIGSIGLENDFELDDGGLIGNGDWEWGDLVPSTSAPPAAHSGTKLWATNLDGDITIEPSEHSLTMTLSIPYGGGILSWWDWWHEDGSDEGHVYVNGVEVYSIEANQLSWQNHRVDLTLWAGQTVEVVFHYLAVGTLDGGAGWYIDDMMLILPCPVPNLSYSTKEAPALSNWGDPIHYSINITNTGIVSAMNAVMTDVIPVGTLYVPGSLSCSSGSCTYDDVDDAVYWSGIVEAPPAPSVVTVDFDVQPEACGMVAENEAVVDDPEMIIDPVHLNTSTEVVGYLYQYEAFEGAFPPAGWTVIDNLGTGGMWDRNDAFGVVNRTNGSGYSAAAEAAGSGIAWDTELWSPAIDLSTSTGALLEFQSNFQDYVGNGDAYVDISTDGGTTWTNVWYWTEDHGPTYEVLDLAAYGGEFINVRWRYTATATTSWYWHIDEVKITEPCTPPDIEVDPLSMESQQGIDEIVTLPLTISNIGGTPLDWLAYEADWSDNFDSYAPGSQMHGQGGWKGWFNDPAYGAIVTTTQSHSAPNSVEIVGASDLVHEYNSYQYQSGTWTFTAWQYIPSSFSGITDFIMLNTYNDDGIGLNWSVQVEFDATTGMVHNDGASGGDLPLITDEWVELRVEIDLTNDTQTFYYDDQLLYSGTWTDEVSGGGATNIAAVDLFANTGSEVYYDDISLIGTCGSPEEVPWLSVAPDSGLVDPGLSMILEVGFDSTGMAGGEYSAELCVASNDPADPLIPVPVTMTVMTAIEPADIELDPLTLESLQPIDSTVTKTLTVSNVGGSPLDWLIYEAGWYDNFDSYATGSQMHGQGGWKGWFNDPTFGALVSSDQSLSPPNSVEIVGASDLVHEYAGYQSGIWTYTAWQYIPSSLSGETYFIMLNSYDDAGSNMNWSTQVCFNSATDLLYDDFSNTCSSGPSLPILYDQWVEIRVEIDLDSDLQTFYYNDQLLYQDSWTEHVSGGGALNIGAVDLFANNASEVYYDNISLLSISPVDEVDWLSAVPDQGATDPGMSSLVDVIFDATGMTSGEYTAELFVASNDPVDPVISVPVTMTLVAPSIEFSKTVGTDPQDCSDTDTIQVPAGTDVAYCYSVTNTGDVTLSLHDLVDSELGVILDNEPYDLEPGVRLEVIITATVDVDTTNDATWTAFVDELVFAQASDSATVDVFTISPAPSIELTKTVGTDLVVCADTDSIQVLSGTVVAYCYRVLNTGDVTLSFHDLVDSELGVILDDEPYELAPGMSYEVIVTATVTTDTTNEATWTAFVDEIIVAEDSDTATVTITIPEPEGFWIYLPLIVKEYNP